MKLFSVDINYHTIYLFSVTWLIVCSIIMFQVVNVIETTWTLHARTHARTHTHTHTHTRKHTEGERNELFQFKSDDSVWIADWPDEVGFQTSTGGCSSTQTQQGHFAAWPSLVYEPEWLRVLSACACCPHRVCKCAAYGWSWEPTSQDGHQIPPLPGLAADCLAEASSSWGDKIDTKTDRDTHMLHHHLHTHHTHVHLPQHPIPTCPLTH